MEFTRRIGKDRAGVRATQQGSWREADRLEVRGVRIGAITYSFNRIASPDPEAIVRAYVEIGLGEAELMSNHCEALRVRPRCRPALAAEVHRRPRAAGRKAGRARETRPMAHLDQRQHMEGVIRKFNDAGVAVTLLCYTCRTA